MAGISKRKRQLQQICRERELKRSKQTEHNTPEQAESSSDSQENIASGDECEYNPHWIDQSSEEEESDIDISDLDEETSSNPFEQMMSQTSHINSKNNFKWFRGCELSSRQKERIRAQERNMRDHANKHSQPLRNFFAPKSSTSEPSTSPIGRSFRQQIPSAQDREAAIRRMEQILRSKRTNLSGTSLLRHEAVLALLYRMQRREPGETREDLAVQVAKSYNRSNYFAKKLVEYERRFIFVGDIPDSDRGRHAKTKSWFDDEGVQLRIREELAVSQESELSELDRRCRVDQELMILKK